MLFSFKNLNPYINLAYFIISIALLYSSENPIIVGIFLIITLVINLKFCTQNFSQYIKIFLLMSLLVVLINPLVSHRGLTIIFYIGYTPITLEATIYGVIAGIKLFSLLLLGNYFNAIMDYERLSYVLLPLGNNLSLIISLSVKFIPEYLDKIKNIKDTQKTKGISIDEGSKVERAKGISHILNAFFFITLEQGITTIKSIKSRGYLNRDKRKKKAIRLKNIDYIFGGVCGLCIALILLLKESYRYEIYPKVAPIAINLESIIAIIAHLIFLSMPILLYLWEEAYLKCKEHRKIHYYMKENS
ncbi:MAG: energy-coupling factor transporter transmembrane component T [Clostridium sp.]